MNKKVFLLILSLGVLLTGWLLAQNTVMTFGSLTVSGIGQENNSFVLYADGRATFANGHITLGTDEGLTGGFYFADGHISVTGDGVPFKIRGVINDSLNLQEWYRGSDTNLVAKLDGAGKFTAQQFEGDATLLSSTRLPIYFENGDIIILNTTGDGSATILHNPNGDNSLMLGNILVALTNGSLASFPAGLTLNDNGTVTLFGGVYGNGIGLTNLNGSSITSGTVAAARIAALNYQSPSAWLTNIGNTGAFTNGLAAGSNITLSTNSGTISIAGSASGYVAGDSPTFNVMNTTNWFTNTLTSVPAFRFNASKSAQDFMQWGTNGTMMGNINSNGVLNLSNNLWAAGSASINNGMTVNNGAITANGGLNLGSQTLSLTGVSINGTASGRLRLADASFWRFSRLTFGLEDPTIPAILQSGTNPPAFSLINSVSNLVSLTLSNLNASQAVFATNGVSSLRSNLVAPSSITVGSSPFNWTNLQSYNVYVFVTGSGVTGTVNLNGTQIFGGIGGGLTVPLQPNEYVTATYSIGTPTMTWKPF